MVKKDLVKILFFSKWIRIKFLHSIYVVLLLFLFPVYTIAQTNDAIQSNASFAEKIYLQLDAKAYTLGNIVWFKAVVLNACDHVPSHLSHVLYAELITPEEIIKEKEVDQN